MKSSILFLFVLLVFTGCAQDAKTSSSDTLPKKDSSGYNHLTAWEKKVIEDKYTDRPFTGDYFDKHDAGLYVCKRCNNPLYRSEDKFDSHCGWPSFDDEIEGAVIRVPDIDGQRTEIICANCHGHLGHVFLGEGFTSKETRHCVNTSSLQFYPADRVKSIPPVIKK